MNTQNEFKYDNMYNFTRDMISIIEQNNLLPKIINKANKLDKLSKKEISEWVDINFVEYFNYDQLKNLKKALFDILYLVNKHNYAETFLHNELDVLSHKLFSPTFSSLEYDKKNNIWISYSKDKQKIFKVILSNYFNIRQEKSNFLYFLSNISLYYKRITSNYIDNLEVHFNNYIFTNKKNWKTNSNWIKFINTDYFNTSIKKNKYFNDKNINTIINTKDKKLRIEVILKLTNLMGRTLQFRDKLELFCIMENISTDKKTIDMLYNLRNQVNHAGIIFSGLDTNVNNENIPKLIKLINILSKIIKLDANSDSQLITNSIDIVQLNKYEDFFIKILDNWMNLTSTNNLISENTKPQSIWLYKDNKPYLRNISTAFFPKVSEIMNYNESQNKELLKKCIKEFNLEYNENISYKFVILSNFESISLWRSKSLKLLLDSFKPFSEIINTFTNLEYDNNICNNSNTILQNYKTSEEFAKKSNKLEKEKNILHTDYKKKSDKNFLEFQTSWQKIKC